MQSTDQESETILSSHKEGTAPGKNKQTSVRSHRDGTVPAKNNVISQERDCSKSNRLLCHLTRKGPLLKKQTVVSSHKKGTASQTDKDPNKIVATDHKITGGSLEPCHNMWHGFATRDSDRRGLCISPSVVKQCFKRIFKHFSYCPGDSTHSVQWVIIQDKPGRVLRSFVLDHSLDAVQPKTV